MPARSALLRAIRKFLARREPGRSEARRREGDATRNFVGLAIPRNRRRRSNKQLFPPAFTLVLAATLVLARLTPSRAPPTKRGRSSRSLSSTLDWTERLLFQAREQPAPLLFPPRPPIAIPAGDGRNVFPVVLPRVVWSLKYKQPSEPRGPNLGIRLAGQEVIWRVAREHLGRTESFRPNPPGHPSLPCPRSPGESVAKLR